MAGKWRVLCPEEVCEIKGEKIDRFRSLVEVRLQTSASFQIFLAAQNRKPNCKLDGESVYEQKSHTVPPLDEPAL